MTNAFPVTQQQKPVVDTEPTLPGQESEAPKTILPDDSAFTGTSKITQRYLDFIEMAMETKNVPYFEGLPGVGKTALINAVAKKRGMFLRTLIGSTMDPTDVAGLPVLKTLPSGEVITEFTKPDWFHEIEQYAKQNPQGAVIFIDEITTASPPVQAALLTFIQDRRIGKFFLPDNVLLIVAGNPPSAAADGTQLAPPTANRFAHIKFEPSVEDWFAGMRVGFNRAEVSEQERRMRGFLIAFLVENRDLINKMPEDPEEASGAWPSMRSWDNAARMLGRVTDESMAEMVIKSFVGEEAGTEYFEWLRQLQIPDYNAVLNNPDSIPWKSLRADELMLLLSIVVDNVNVGNYEQTLKVFRAAKGAKKDDVVATLIVALKRQAEEAHRKEGVDSSRIRLEIARLGQFIIGDLEKKSRAA